MARPDSQCSASSGFAFRPDEQVVMPDFRPALSFRRRTTRLPRCEDRTVGKSRGFARMRNLGAGAAMILSRWGCAGGASAAVMSSNVSRLDYGFSGYSPVEAGVFAIIQPIFSATPI